MTENIPTISYQLSERSQVKKPSQAQRIPQYTAGLIAHLSALSSGLVLGWTFCCGPDGVNLGTEYHLSIGPDEFSWIGSATTLGAASICFPIGMISDAIGRKKSILLIVIPVTIGWSLIIWAKSIYMLYVGRFLAGFSCGGFSLVTPLYTSEISEKSIRGRLGACYELLLTIGILSSYILGSTVKSIYWISVASAIVPLVFSCLFTFMPETPIYYLKKGKEEAALRSLEKLRGLEYNVKAELQMHKEYLQYLKINYKSKCGSFLTRSTMKGLFIIYGLMFFQQISGVNAIVFYSNRIFTDAQVNVDLATVIVGAIMVFGVFMGTICVDYVGRKPLLMFSCGLMSFAMLLLGAHFYMVDHYYINVVLIPIAAVCIYVFTTEVGLGPIPFVMIGEIFETRIQGAVGSTACFLSWILAFFITKMFNDMLLYLGNDITVWIFSAVSAIGVIFVQFVVFETKNKSLQQIKMEMDTRWI